MLARAEPGSVPERGPIEDYLNALHQRVAGIGEGEIATYIPELAKADPDTFGIAVATVDGKVYTAGDAQHQFTIQSISKTFIYGYALAEYGREAVLAQLRGRIDAHEGEPLVEALLQPARERGVAILQTSRHRGDIAGSRLRESGLDPLISQTHRRAHGVDRRAERGQVGLVDEQCGGEAAEGEVERFAPRLELRAHLDQLADERQIRGFQACGAGEQRT